ncbi:hypothetical protein Tco_0758167 [Tanacetum coccineum]
MVREFTPSREYVEILHSCTPASDSSLWELSYLEIISINITSPSSSLVQMSSALGDEGTNPRDSKSELNLRTFSGMNEIDGSGAQINFVLEDWGTNPSDSSIEFCFRTCSVVMEANGSGCGCGLELVFLRLPSSSSLSGSLTWDSLDFLGWIVMALIELWICVEHYGSIIG